MEIMVTSQDLFDPGLMSDCETMLFFQIFLDGYVLFLMEKESFMNVLILVLITRSSRNW